jgi:hypothetical protein
MTELTDTLKQTRELFLKAQARIDAWDNHEKFDTEDKILVIAAINNNDVQTIRDFSELGVDLTREKGFLLSYAAFHNKLEAVKCLINDIGLSITVDDFQPLRSSINGWATDTAKFLLTQNLTMPVVAEAFAQACIEGNMKLVQHMTETFTFTDTHYDLAFDGAVANERKNVALHIFSQSEGLMQEDIAHRIDKHWGTQNLKTTGHLEYNKDYVINEFKEQQELKQSLNAVMPVPSDTKKTGRKLN